MSQLVRLSSKLAKDEETNGLDSLASSLRDNPDQVVCAFIWLTVPRLIVDTETHETTPTVMIKRIEPVATVDKVPQAVQDLVAQLYQTRLNRTPLPFEVIEVIEGGYVNPDEIDDEGE